MAKRKQLSRHAEQVKSLLLADDPATHTMWGEYELSGSLADRMGEIVYNHGYEVARLLAAGDEARAQATRRRLEAAFWELAKHEGLVEMLEKAWADGLSDGGGVQENPKRKTVACGHCFDWAWQKIAFDSEYADAVLYHGTIAEPFSRPPHRYAHAWLEKDGIVRDWQCMEAYCGGKWQGVGYPVEVFDELFQPKRAATYTQEQALKYGARTGHYGPWTKRERGKKNPETDMGGDWHGGMEESPQQIVDDEHFGFWLSPDGVCFVVEDAGGHSGTAYGIYVEALGLRPSSTVDPEQYLDKHGWLRCGDMPGHFGFVAGEDTVLTQAQLDVLFDLSLIMPNASTRKFIARLIEEEIKRRDEGMQKNPAELLTVCSWCRGVIYDGPVGPQGEVSHGICYACAVEHAEEFGITDEDLEEMREEQGGAKKNPSSFPERITADDVAAILASQPGNSGKSLAWLKDHWLASSRFRMMPVLAGLNELGVTSGKTGETYSAGQPIIVDDNINQVARAAGGLGGAAPDFLVLDGQNRVVAARREGPRAVLLAYVGERVLDAVRAQMRKAEAIFAEVDEVAADFVAGRAPLSHLRSLVARGLMLQDELEGLRAARRAVK